MYKLNINRALKNLIYIHKAKYKLINKINVLYIYI